RRPRWHHGGRREKRLPGAHRRMPRVPKLPGPASDHAWGAEAPPPATGDQPPAFRIARDLPKGVTDGRMSRASVASRRSAQSSTLRALPAVETVLRHPALEPALRDLPRARVVDAVRAERAERRARLRSNGGAAAAADEIARRAAERAAREQRPALRRVLNATGVVLHTNLGRAPLPEAARRALDEMARGYSSLEYDLERGRRGERGAGVERWLVRLTRAEAADVGNNAPAAAP